MVVPLRVVEALKVSFYDEGGEKVENSDVRNVLLDRMPEVNHVRTATVPTWYIPADAEIEASPEQI